MRVKVSLFNIIDAIRVPFCKRRQLYRAFHAILGFYPHRISLYRQALVHKSFVGKHDGGDKLMHNERLEFLGDAVLDAVVGDIVYRRFEGKNEGFLTTTRSKIVQRESLGRLAVETGLNRLIMSHVGANKTHNSYMEGNAFEALVGAVYLDRGYDYCMYFIERRVLRHLIDLNKVASSEVNFKSRLLEWSQKKKCRVEYELVRQVMGENGSPVFYSRVWKASTAARARASPRRKASRRPARRPCRLSSMTRTCGNAYWMPAKPEKAPRRQPMTP